MNQPIFNSNSFSELLGRVQYETYLLEAAYVISEQALWPELPDSVIYRFNDSTPQFGVVGGGCLVEGDWKPRFLEVGAPLILVSCFKVLDQLIEWAITAVMDNGKCPWQFSEKIKKLNKLSEIFPEVIESRPWLKERIIGLYKTLDPIRGVIIHGKQFTSVGGNICITGTKKDPNFNLNISSNDLRIFAKTILSIINYSINEWVLNDFREKELRHDFGILQQLHGKIDLNQKKPFHPTVRLYSDAASLSKINPKSIQQDLSENYKDKDCSFDLRVIVIQDGVPQSAYLIPWRVIPRLDSVVGDNMDIEEHQCDIPSDIKPNDIDSVLSGN